MFPFKILIDDSFINYIKKDKLEPVDKKHILSIVNDFEDGVWRYKNFQKFIWNNVAETALSYNEREKLIGDPASTLIEAAQNLRLTDKNNDVSKGSELAEILLYGIMKHVYNALTVV
ncbi:MAG: Hachiman antiphage defense system protein HamA [Fidelibacterota bacterium]